MVITVNSVSTSTDLAKNISALIDQLQRLNNIGQIKINMQTNDGVAITDATQFTSPITTIKSNIDTLWTSIKSQI